MSATKGSKPEDTDSSNAVNTHDDESVSSSGSQEDIDRASAQAKNEKCVTCKNKKRRRMPRDKENRR